MLKPAVPPRKYPGITVLLYEAGPNEEYEWNNQGPMVGLCSYMFTPDPPKVRNVDTGDLHTNWPIGGGFVLALEPRELEMGHFKGKMPPIGARWLCIIQSDIFRRLCECVNVQGTYVLQPRVGAVICKGPITSEGITYEELDYIAPSPNVQTISALEGVVILVKPYVRGV